MRLYTNRKDLMEPYRTRFTLVFTGPEEAEAAVVWFPRGERNLAAAAAAVKQRMSVGAPLYIVVEGGSLVEEAAELAAAGATLISATLLPFVLRQLVRVCEKVQETEGGGSEAAAGGGSADTSYQGTVAGSPDGILPNLVAVFSPATHVGKTFLSLCLAVSLARHGVRTVLVDLDCDKADLWWASGMAKRGIPPRVTAANWGDVAGDPVSFIDEHPYVPGLFVLPGGGLSGLPRAAEILPALAPRFGAVVADLAPLPSLPHVVWTLQAAARVILIADLSPKAVVQVTDALPKLAGILPRERALLVLNRVSRSDTLRARRFARNLGYNRFYPVPEVREAGRSLQKGTLLRFSPRLMWAVGFLISQLPFLPH